MALFSVQANGQTCGIYQAVNRQSALDACARDAGYQSEADMVAQLEQPSNLTATRVAQTFTVWTTGESATARRRAGDRDDFDAANRAIVRLFGRSARARGWSSSSYGTDARGAITNNNYITDVIDRNSDGSYCVLGQANFTA